MTIIYDFYVQKKILHLHDIVHFTCKIYYVKHSDLLISWGRVIEKSTLNENLPEFSNINVDKLKEIGQQEPEEEKRILDYRCANEGRFKKFKATKHVFNYCF